MENSNSSYRATIIATIITVVGSIVVALITNWDKFPESLKRIDTSPKDSSTSAQPTKPITPFEVDITSVINIAGGWRDPNNLNNESRITQLGDSFQYNGWGVLPQGISFESTGSGTVIGQNITITYTAKYQNGWISQGTCSGKVSINGSQMTLTCTDNVLGTFVSSGVRQ